VESKAKQLERLKQEYLWVFQWINRLILAFTLILLLDFFLPPVQSTERIVDGQSFRVRRNTSHSTWIMTDGGRKFTVDGNQHSKFAEFNQTGVVNLDISRIFRIVLRVRDGEKSLGVSFHYSYLVFIPVILFIISALGVLAKDRVTIVYNTGSAAFVFLIFQLILFFV
jgi:hypothetical protein